MTKVFLNVYDLDQKVNNYSSKLGLGLYHSGVQIGSTEYTFGGHEGSWTGVMEVEPKVNHPGYRETIEMGETKLTYKEIKSVVDKLKDEFIGNTYNLTNRNCNHFSNRLVNELLGKNIPGYVNRAAGFGGMFSSVLDFFKMKPASLSSASNPNASSSSSSSSSGNGYNVNQKK